jgi:hypothetical protein
VGVILLAVAATIYLSLALLPPGRQALIGILTAFAVSQVLYWMNVPEGAEAGWLAMLIKLAQGGIALALLAQAVRGLLPSTAPKWSYHAIVGLGFMTGVLIIRGV